MLRGLCLASVDVAVEQGARLDDQLGHREVAANPAAGHDFQSPGVDIAIEAAADHDVIGLQFSFDAAFLPDGHFRLGVDAAFDEAVDVQVVAQGKVADKL